MVDSAGFAGITYSLFFLSRFPYLANEQTGKFRFLYKIENFYFNKSSNLLPVLTKFLFVILHERGALFFDLSPDESFVAFHITLPF